MMAIAAIATEMRFRTIFHRIVEYIYVILLLLLGKDAGHISVGIGQISIRHYQNIFGISQISSLILSLSARGNLVACCEFIERLGPKNLEELAFLYNGKSTVFYRRALRENFYSVKRILMK